MENPFAWKAENWDKSMKILSAFEGCVEETHEYFEHLIDDEVEGDWHEWLALGNITTSKFDFWPSQVPYIETEFGDYAYDPGSKKWLTGDELVDRLHE